MFMIMFVLIVMFVFMFISVFVFMFIFMCFVWFLGVVWLGLELGLYIFSQTSIFAYSHLVGNLIFFPKSFLLGSNPYPPFSPLPTHDLTLLPLSFRVYICS